MIACMERVVDEWRKAALEHAAESGEEPQLLVVTKSLSTLSYPHSAKLGLRVVLLTPVLNPPPFDKHKSVIPAPLPGAVGSPMPLICAGDADPYSMMPRRICSPTMCARTLVPTIPSKCRTIGRRRSTT